MEQPPAKEKPRYWVRWMILPTLMVAGMSAIESFSEPSVDGNTLSLWIIHGANSEGAEEQTNLALHKMAPEAIPFLLDWIHAKDSKLKKEVDKFANSHSWVDIQFRDESEWRRMGVAGFAYLGEAGSPGIATLKTFVEEKDPVIRGYAIEALGYIGEPAVPALLELMNHRSVEIRSTAVLVVGNSPLQNHTAFTPRLLQLVFDPDPGIQRAAYWCIARRTDHPESIGPALARIASDSAHPARTAALVRLQFWSTNRNLVMPVFQKGISDTDSNIRISSIRGLAGITGEDIFDLLLSCVEDPASDVRLAALEELGWCTNHVDEIKPILLQALTDPDPDIRNAVEGDLSKLGLVEGWFTVNLRSISDLSADLEMYISTFGGNRYLPTSILKRRFAALP